MSLWQMTDRICRAVVQSFTGWILVLMVTGCSGLPGFDRPAEPEPGALGYVSGFYGAVAGDDPHAVLEARRMMSLGASAADAAVVMVMIQMVSQPQMVNPAGGGLCMVYDPSVPRLQVLNFLPPSLKNAAGDITLGPLMFRGLALLHARYGSLDWSSVVVSAERLARLGLPSSLAGELAGSRPGPNPQMAALLGTIRSKGAGAFYQGPLAREVLTHYQRAGLSLEAQQLRSLLPQWEAATTVPMPPDTLIVPAQVRTGPVLAQMALLTQQTPPTSVQAVNAYNALIRSGGTFDPSAPRQSLNFDKLEDDEPLTNIIPLSQPSTRQQQQWFRAKPPRQPSPGAQHETSAHSLSGSSLVVVDRFGLAVGCWLSGQPAHNTAVPLPGLGFTTWRPQPSFDFRRSEALVPPVMVINLYTSKFKTILAGSGGSAGHMAIVSSLHALAQNPADFNAAYDQPRIAPAMSHVFLEAQTPKSWASAFKRARYRVQTLKPADSLGRLYGISCLLGLPEAPNRRLCDVKADPRWPGLSAQTQVQTQK